MKREVLKFHRTRGISFSIWGEFEEWFDAIYYKNDVSSISLWCVLETKNSFFLDDSEICNDSNDKNALFKYIKLILTNTKSSNRVVCNEIVISNRLTNLP